MVLSKACSYAILATLYISRKNSGDYVSIKEISKQLNISFHFLTKILQTLTEKGILESLRGPRGGVRLARYPSDLTLLDIILAIDGPELFTECILGLPGCGVAKPCPMHEHWEKIRNDLKARFASKTLADISERVEEFKLRLSRGLLP